MKSKGPGDKTKSLLTDMALLSSIENGSLTTENMLEHIIYYYENIIGCMPGNVYWLDRNGIATGCNKNVLDMFGLKSIDDFKGLSFEAMGKLGHWPQLAIQTFKRDTMEVIRTGRPRLNIEEPPIQHIDGRTIHFLTHRVPLFNKKHGVVGMVGISIDITERKQLESALKESRDMAEAANQAKTEFLANMRHDIRTPLSGIVGFSEILKMESKEPRIREYADNLIASSHALLDLMDEVLEAVRVSSGEIPVLKRKFNLSKTFNDIMALYAAKSHEKNIDLTLTLDPALPRFVIGDKIRLHRITLELVGNALNFTDMGSVTVKIELAKRENLQLVIKMVITDTGMGIPKDKQQEIYLQFKRLTPSYQGIYKGAGLGLFVVKQFIDEIGGEIYVSSEPQKGTCFTCLIPLQESLLDDSSGVDSDEELKIDKSWMTPIKQQAALSSLDEPNPDSSSRILVVEDNGIAQMAAKTLLSAMSCHVDVAANGMDALALCRKNKYDLIFMDIGLGEGLDGYEVTHHLRGMPETSEIPVIALTAHGGDENKQRCIEAGMDAVLTKPLTRAHAADMLANFIPARRAAPPVEKQTPWRDLPDSDAELFQLGQFALLDTGQALQNCGDQAMVIELLTMMLNTEMPKDLTAMKQAYADRNYETVEKLAHKIKGGAVYIGTTRMKYACQYVERYWKTGERELFDALYHQALSVIDETCLHIKVWLEKQ
ncbi:ATP-binding protein [Legionella sp. CNM-4043-24]|uniref:ATP-binding protein n=1 Tax=Legionella sp. CNM-4043-24 TaxID=3421646 RepID=UPI00403A85EE